MNTNYFWITIYYTLLIFNICTLLFGTYQLVDSKNLIGDECSDIWILTLFNVIFNFITILLLLAIKKIVKLNYLLKIIIGIFYGIYLVLLYSFTFNNFFNVSSSCKSIYNEKYNLLWCYYNIITISYFINLFFGLIILIFFGISYYFIFYILFI